jgi:SAM-dependent methyltransferase
MSTDPKERFSVRADDYAAHRVGYPSEAVDFVLADLGDPAKLIVADIGAGTGISSRAFSERGARVIAIEPNEHMREKAQADPLVTWKVGTGEATGLAEKSVDLAVAFQAFHWFAVEAAMEELRRITRRRVAVAQYERDEESAVSLALSELYRTFATDDTEARRLRALEKFKAFPNARVLEGVFPWKREFDLATLYGVMASSSYLPREGKAAEAMRAEAKAIFERERSGDRLTVSMKTHVLCAEL